jgi:hypothetical protein
MKPAQEGKAGNRALAHRTAPRDTLPSLAENLWNRASFQFDDRLWAEYGAPRWHTRYAYKQQLIPRRMSIGELLADSEIA